MNMNLNENPYLLRILNNHPKENWLRLSHAILLYGAKDLYENHSDLILNLNELEKYVYGDYPSKNNSKEKIELNIFFDELKSIRANIDELNKRMQKTIIIPKDRKKIRRQTKRKGDKENKIETNINSSIPKQGKTIITTLEKKMKTTKTRNSMLNCITVREQKRSPFFNSEPVKLVIGKKGTTIKQSFSKSPHSITMPNSIDARSIISDKCTMPVKIKDKKNSSKKEDQMIAPKYLQNVKSKIKDQLDYDKYLSQTNTDKIAGQSNNIKHQLSSCSTPEFALIQPIDIKEEENSALEVANSFLKSSIINYFYKAAPLSEKQNINGGQIQQINDMIPSDYFCCYNKIRDNKRK